MGIRKFSEIGIRSSGKKGRLFSQKQGILVSFYVWVLLNCILLEGMIRLVFSRLKGWLVCIEVGRGEEISSLRGRGQALFMYIWILI